MAQFTRLEVTHQIYETGLIPIFYHPDLEIAKNIVKACYDGGVRVMEYTNRGDFAHALYAELNRYVIRSLPGMIFGAGTILDGATAALYLQKGANFIVSPVLKDDIAVICNRRKVAWIPGCGSVTEISHAEELGAEFVKIFPAQSVGGPDFIKAVKGPMPWTSFIITGGVTTDEDNLRQWFKAGACCVGMGSHLITKEIIRTKNYDLLQEKTAQVISLIKKIKSNIKPAVS